MTKNFNILFYVRRDKADEQDNAPIYCRITVDGKRSELAIKREVALTKWQPSKGYVKGTNEEAKSLNTYIDSVRDKVYEHQKQLMDANKAVTAEAIKNSFLGISQKSKSLFRIFEEHNEKIKQLVGKQFADGTRERYETVLKHLKEFVEKRYGLSDYYVSDVNHEFIQEFDHFLRATHNCANNTASQYLKNLKKIIRQAAAKGLITTDPFLTYKIKFKKVDRGYLTQEEIDAIAAKNFTIPRLSQVRDIFLFQCYTGLAYADIKKLSREHLVKGADGELWLSTNRTKTGTPVNVPLLPQALAIINKYESHPEASNKGLLLPVLSNQRMNGYLKEIGDLCNITKNLHSHLGRHSFCTTVTLANGVSLEVVSRMAGHSSINSTRTYARMVDSRVSEEMQGLRSRMALKPVKTGSHD